MTRFWCADFHLGHGNIIKYCDRPFKDAHHMNKVLTDNVNMRVVPGDVVVHVGDFCTKGRAHGVEGLRYKSAYYLELLNGTWVLLSGNHDRNNGTKPVCKSMFLDLGVYKAFAAHHPQSSVDYPNVVSPEIEAALHQTVDVVLCGHVHTAWKYKWYNGLLHVNVGVDQWKYQPVKDSELICYIDSLFKSGKPRTGEG